MKPRVIFSKQDFFNRLLGDGSRVNAGELNNNTTKETKVQNGTSLRDHRGSASGNAADTSCRKRVFPLSPV